MIGDSHAAASSMFQNIAEKYNYKLIGIRLNGLYTESMMKSQKYNHAKKSSEVFEYLKSNIKTKDIVYSEPTNNLDE